MRNSCITHRANSEIVIIRKEYIDLLGHLGAAVMLAYFEYWHNIRIASAQKAAESNKVAVNHGDEPHQDESLYQFHTINEMLEATLGVIGKPAMKTGINILVERGYITKHRNPNPRYAFDNTVFYLLHTDKVNSDLSQVRNCETDTSETNLSYSENSETDASETDLSQVRNCRMVEQKLTDGATETDRTIPETTTETTTENEKEVRAADVVDFKKFIFDAGIRLLADAGDAESKARAKIGKLRKEYGDADVLAALSVANEKQPSEPYSFLVGILKKRTGQSDKPRASSGYSNPQYPAGLVLTDGCEI